MKSIFTTLFCIAALAANAQTYNQIDEMGQITQRDENGTGNFNKHSNDTTEHKEIPRGIYVWTVDRRFGDRTPAVVDTLQHMYMNSIFNTGLYGEYNTTGNNYTARESRIVIDRPLPSQFIFTQPYSYIIKQPDELHFTNTLSPITNISYDNCGNKTNGEDHIDAKFAVNAGKRLGFGFDLNYAYARGYFANQSTSHFGATFWASYIGDQYNMHTILSTYHQKAAENGGITDDNYVTHPESFDDAFSDNEIPTVLSQNWNRNNSLHFFLTHRYSLGFYRMEKLTEAELKARKFAAESKRENEGKANTGDEVATTGRAPGDKTANTMPSGRPDGAVIAGDEPTDTGTAAIDTSRIKVDDTAKMDSLLAAKQRQDSIDATMKRVFVPVTSFIHTVDINRYDRIYQAYDSPDNYYTNTYFTHNDDWSYGGDSIYDRTKLMSVKNTLAIALLEGFNKYAKAGLKVFASHELRRFDLPEMFETNGYSLSRMANWTENTVSVGGQITKTHGKTLHYNLLAEAWLVGEDAGQLTQI